MFVGKIDVFQLVQDLISCDYWDLAGGDLMAEIRKVGIPSPRVAGEEKVGGKALYAVDVVLPNLLWVKVLRSPIAHGKITRIDINEAQRVEGVKTVLTGQEIAGVMVGRHIDEI